MLEAIAPALAVLILAAAGLLRAEARIRENRARAEDARRRAWDAQLVAGATHRQHDAPPTSSDDVPRDLA